MRREEVTITTEAQHLPGILEIPAGAHLLVIFAHGSGSSRFSSRNRFVAELLQRARFATLLFDLLGADEALDRRNVFDIPLLGDRVAAALNWARHDLRCQHLPVGLFGASTGAAAALTAAAEFPQLVASVVSRGGRPDLAGAALRKVRVPTLLIAGEDDSAVLKLNQEAYALLRCPKDLRVIPRATHLFEEPGTLELAALEAQHWFEAHADLGARHAGM